MALFDSIIETIADRFGLGDQAGPLLREVVQLVTGRPGGIGGFLDQAKGTGLDVSSWLGKPDASALSAQQTGNTLGESALGAIASRLGLPSSAVTAAIGFVLPKVVGMLTPGGVVPSGIPPAASSFLRDFPQAVGARAVPETDPQIAARGAMPLPPAASTGSTPAIGRWAIPAVIAIGVLGALWYFTSARTTPTAENVPAAPSAAVPSSGSSSPPATQLAALPPGFTGADLVAALNQSVIKVPGRNAELTPDSKALLRQAAGLAKQLPPGTVIEIDGYVERTADAAADMQVSQQRADAVRGALVDGGVDPSKVVAKGHGAVDPASGGNTLRMIDYKLAKS
jgi:uncharacterized protein YidB (DUF937 family)